MLHDVKQRELIQSSKNDQVKVYMVTDCCNHVYYEIVHITYSYFSRTLAEGLSLFDKLVDTNSTY